MSRLNVLRMNFVPGPCECRADVSLRFMTGVRELVHVKKDRSAMILGGDVNC